MYFSSSSFRSAFYYGCSTGPTRRAPVEHPLNDSEAKPIIAALTRPKTEDRRPKFSNQQEKAALTWSTDPSQTRKHFTLWSFELELAYWSMSLPIA